MKFKFICLNLWRGGTYMDAIVDFLSAENADVVALQEVHDGHDITWKPQFRSMDVIRKELGYPFEHFAPAFVEVKDFGKMNQGQAILSRFPITHVETTFYDIPFGERDESTGEFEKTPRNLQHVRLNVGGAEVNVFNTQGIWSPIATDNPRRQAMADLIVEKARGLPHTIIAGDFNARNTTQAMKTIEKEFPDVFGSQLKSSFNLKEKPAPIFASLVVDMIYAGKDLRVIEASCPNVNITDHLPLVATFETL